MESAWMIRNEERAYLRKLAKKYLEYAMLPVMEERRKLWYAHNSLAAERPVIVMEHLSFMDDILPALKCESPAARHLEIILLLDIVNHEKIDDDKVIPPYLSIHWNIGIDLFGVKIEREHAKDSSGRDLGYAFHHPIKDLKKDLHKLKPSTFHVDRASTLEFKAFVEEIVGDLLPVRIKNQSFVWHAAPSARAVELMGLETMMVSMLDYPDEMHALYRFLTDDILAYVRWQQEEGLLVLNNENDYAGAGSYGFTTELPSAGYRAGGSVKTKDLWLNMNSQETVGISPSMYEEFVLPYYMEIAGEFGLVYYGCCEPVHDIWKKRLEKLPNLRKVSISPWCNEEMMGEALRGSRVIYSRKPSPNFIGVGEKLDEEAFSAHIAKTLQAAKGCSLEFIFRDTYTLSGDASKPERAVKIVRDLIERIW